MYQIFKTKESSFVKPPSFVPSGTLEIESNGTYDISSKEFVNVLVESKKIAQVAVSNVSTWILTKSGDLYGCGRGETGEQGTGNSSNVYVFTKRMTDVKKVFCSRYSDLGNTTWVIKKDGTLWGTGYATYGQQGDGNTSTHSVYTFTQRMTDVKDAFVYNTMTWVIKNDNSLWGSGDNTGGQMGLGTNTPERVGSFRKIMDNVKKAQLFSYRSGIILKTDGTLWNFGQGSNYVEVVIYLRQRLDNVIDFVVPKKEGSGDNTNCWAIRADGTLWGCGVNPYGQQGNGQSGRSSSSNVKNFTQRLTNVKSVACSGATTWAIKNDGTLWGCGYGAYGQQGSGSTDSVLTFTQRMSNVEKVDCLEDLTTALKTDGTLWSCGNNNYGQQGDGSTTPSNVFAKKMDNVKDFYMQENVTWALKNDNTLWGTGRNNYGQQGSGNTNNVYKFTQRTFG